MQRSRPFVLAVDVGNTNTVFGLFRRTEPIVAASQPLALYRIETRIERPGDELAALLSAQLTADPVAQRAGIALQAISHLLLVSVVPKARLPLQTFAARWLNCPLLEVGNEIPAGVQIRLATPHTVGTDRLVNAAAAYAEHQCGLIVVDMGTSTTFDVVAPDGAFVGGAIAPGLALIADALSTSAAKLPRVPLVPPPTAVAGNTVHAMQSGLVFGYVSLVDGLVTRMKSELDFVPKVIATGGLAPVIAAQSQTITAVDERLTLRGLWRIAVTSGAIVENAHPNPNESL